jgi:hypothetical protein
MSEPPVEQVEKGIVDPRTPPRSESGEAPVDRPVVERLKGLFGKPAVGSVGELTDAKETHALAIALIITWTFAVCAVLVLVGIYSLLRSQPSDAEDLLAKAGLPALKEAGTFLSSVFGPLLAFVLGYYFGERKSR